MVDDTLTQTLQYMNVFLMQNFLLALLQSIGYRGSTSHRGGGWRFRGGIVGLLEESRSTSRK